MPTQQEINLAAYKSGKKPEEIQRLLQEKQGIVSAPPIQTTIAPAPTIKPSEVTAPTGATYGEQNILSPNVTGFTKPVIATKDAPVISTPSAVGNVGTPGDISSYSSMTGEQNKNRTLEIYTKDASERTDEDRRFLRYIEGRKAFGDDPFDMKTGKSSGTTTYSTQLNRSPEMYQSSVKNPDGTWTVTYKDGATQVITENPTKTVFPEGTPEYFAQKQADEAEKRIQVLTEQMNTEAERRKQETADLVAKYGENIAGQFASQKAEIEAQGAKRMEATKNMLAGRGAGRSGMAVEKVDEIAKNIETTITQAKAKADLELMAFRMEREGADAEAISAMRTNIANVQTRIDQANYENQLEIIKLNQENATSGAEAMNNLLATISNGDEIASNADIEKSQALGYFVNKDGTLMLDSQKRPIQFEGNSGDLDPTSIQAYADAFNKGIIDETTLNKLSPADRAAVMKNVSVNNGTWVGTGFNAGTGEMRTDRHNNPVAMTTDVAKTLGLVEGVDYTVGDPFTTGSGKVLYTARLNGDGLKTTIKALDLAANDPSNSAFMTQSGKPRWTYINMTDQEWLSKTPEEKAQVVATMYKNEGGNGSINAGTFTIGATGGGQTAISPQAQAVIDQINQNGGKPQDYILGTSADSQKLLQEVLQGLNAQGGTGTLASDTRTQSLNLATDTINNLLDNKAFAGSFRARNDWTNFLGANAVTNFKNDVDKLAGQLLQIDGPTLKAMFGPQISNSDVEAIKRTILQGLNPTEQTPAAFEKTLNDVKNKIKAYIDRLPQNQTGGNTPQNTQTTTAPIVQGESDIFGSDW